MVASVSRPPAASKRLRRDRRGRARGTAEWCLQRVGSGGRLAAGLLLRLLQLLLDLKALFAKLVELLLNRLALRPRGQGHCLLAALIAGRNVARQVLELREGPVGIRVGLILGDDALRLDRAIRIVQEGVDVDHLPGD